MSDTDARESSHVHWLLLGSLSSAPNGRRFILDYDGFAETVRTADLRAKVEIGAALGASRSMIVEIGFEQLKQYAMKHVLASVPVLESLRKLAEDLGGPSARRPSDDATVAKVIELIGDGPLAAELRRTFANEDLKDEPPAAEPAPAPAKTDSESGLVGELLERHETRQADTKRAVDSFITAVLAARGRKPASGEPPKPSNRRARELIETSVFGAVAAILEDPAVTQPEALWRGLQLVAKQAPRRSSKHGNMLVEVVDVAPSGIEAAMRECLDDEPMNRPDAYFCFDRIQDPERLAALASTAEDMHAPIIVGVGPGLFGTDDPESIMQVLRDAKPDPTAAMPEGWAELRLDEVSRWLSVTANDVVVAAEGAGSSRRTVLGSSVFALAAMLAASYRETGGFARILGKDGSLKAPGLREIAKGRESGTSIPTAAFLSIRAQSELAELGIIGLGSGRNSDLVALSNVPTVRGSKDAVPLPAQILTGRLVRFARWVCDQVPGGQTREQIVNLFKEAATVFLFPGLNSTNLSNLSSGGAELHAGVIDIDGKPVIRLVANVHPRLAGIPFEVGFDLPLGVDIADSSPHPS